MRRRTSSRVITLVESVRSWKPVNLLHKLALLSASLLGGAPFTPPLNRRLVDNAIKPFDLVCCSVINAKRRKALCQTSCSQNVQPSKPLEYQHPRSETRILGFPTSLVRHMYYS